MESTQRIEGDVITLLDRNTDMFKCVVDIKNLGRVVISQARNPYQAQLLAARFLDTNYPGENIVWVGGYHGGNTEYANPQSTYYGGI